MANVTGTNNGEFLYGTSGDDTVQGLGGDDILVGSTGGDAYDGGDGFDTVSYWNSVSGEFSTAIIVNLSTNSAAGGWAFGDSFTSIEAIYATNGVDWLIGDENANRFFGYAGNDLFEGRGGSDTLEGAGGDDTLEGEGGDDRLVGGAGGDNMDGGDGFDYADYTYSAAVVVNLGSNSGAGGEAFGDSYTAIEGVLGSQQNDWLVGDGNANYLKGRQGNDLMSGAAGEDNLLGDSGDDTLEGNEGNDRLTGGLGADALDGGLGNDTADYSDSANAVVINLGANTAAGGHAFGDSFTSIESVIGTGQQDWLVGSFAGNALTGGGGNDLISGKFGDDTLQGDGGNDTLNGQAGKDQLIAGDGDDELNGMMGDDELLAGTGNDYLTGGTGNDRLAGSDGDDTIFGGADDDTDLLGGKGADRIHGGDGADIVSYFFSQFGVTVDLRDKTASGGEAEGDTLISIEGIAATGKNDILLGNAEANRFEGFGGDDVLYGRLGDDSLTGWAGNDTLNGGDGADRLRGDDGADRFVYSALSDSGIGIGLRDIILDFAQGQDLISLTQIDARAGATGNQAFTFIGAAGFSGVAGQLRYSSNGDITIVAVDTNGDSVRDMQIELKGAYTLTADDFQL